MKILKFLLRLTFLVFLITLLSCRSQRFDPSKITMRPRVFIENAAPVPIIDEYDFIGVQIGTIDNIFTEDTGDRTYALWFTLDRRSAITLQKESIRRRGQALQLIIAGQVVGFHVLQQAITNGVIPFVLSNNLTEENAMMLYQELTQSITHLQAELNDKKG
ncbi:MAG: hypothetical protein CBC04_09195 [Verrucomicrobia bacterium TMED44]|nr:MAG: hypothetical protein CBC04_09195 [Verrucomicrobia bacterium TMED44]